MTDATRRAVVVGAGNIALRHLRNLRKMRPGLQIAAIASRSSAARTQELGEAANVVHERVDEAISWGPHLAVIANPTSNHVQVATQFANVGAHLFVEKPLASNLTGVDELISACRARDLVLTVGYDLRFYRPLAELRDAVRAGSIGAPFGLRVEVGQHLPSWRPGRDYRTTVSAQAALGGGAVLELSHELDYSRWLLGEVTAVRATTARLGDLELDVEDAAEIILTFERGAIGSVHLDMLARPAMRRCSVWGSNGMLSLDWSTGSVVLENASGERRRLGPADGELPDPFTAELNQFLESVEHGVPAGVTPGDARRVVELCLAIKRSAATGQEVLV